MVATDRISAFDVVLPTADPGQGAGADGAVAVLVRAHRDLVPNHLITADARRVPGAVRRPTAELAGRAMLVRRAEVVPIECVARGYLTGLGLEGLPADAARCAGSRCPPGLVESERLPEPIFTPTTKADHRPRRATSRSTRRPS